MLILENPSSLEAAQRQRDDLAKALYAVLVCQGILNTDGVVTGPDLLMVADQIKEQHGFTEENTAPSGYGGPRV